MPSHARTEGNGAPNANSTKSVRSARTLLIALVTGVVASAACGSDSSEEAFSSFLGTWKIEDTSTFTLTCPGDAQPQDAQIWDELAFDAGILSDIVEITGGAREVTGNQCRFGYDVKGQTASLSAIDGFTKAAPTCAFALQVDRDNTGAITSIDSIQITPNPTQWSLALQPAVKDAPPKAILNGAAQWVEKIQMPTATGVSTTAAPACTYVVVANLTKFTKH